MTPTINHHAPKRGSDSEVVLPPRLYANLNQPLVDVNEAVSATEGSPPCANNTARDSNLIFPVRNEVRALSPFMAFHA